VTQRKDTRHPRRGSENRQRTKAVLVRLTPAEHDVLTGAAERAGKGAATMLRETFLAGEHAETRPGTEEKQ
jgi:hypothetical protein